MIATIFCTPRCVVKEKRGTLRNGKEYHRVDILVDTEDGTASKPVTKQLVVQFMSGDGEQIRLPRSGARIQLAVSITSSQYNNNWFNNVRALGFLEV
jgi:hypothetical protein